MSDERALVSAWRSACKDVESLAWFKKQAPSDAFIPALNTLQGWGRAVGIMGTGSRNANLKSKEHLSKAVISLERLTLPDNQLAQYGLVTETSGYVRTRKMLGKKELKASAWDQRRRFIEDQTKFQAFVTLMQDTLKTLEELFPPALNEQPESTPSIQPGEPGPAGSLQATIDRGYLQHAIVSHKAGH